MLQPLFDWVENTILFFGYPGILLLMTLESMVFPLPSEAILPFAGFLVSQGKLNLWWVALAGTIGSMIGSWLSYEFGKYGGRAFLKKYGKFILLNETHLAWTENWFKRYGDKTIFFSRLLPVVRHFISIPAGAAKMKKAKFFAYTFVGAFIWNLFLTYVGVLLGSQWSSIGDYTKPFEIGILVIIGGFVAWFIFKEVEKRTLQGKKIGKEIRTIIKAGKGEIKKIGKGAIKKAVGKKKQPRKR